MRIHEYDPGSVRPPAGARGFHKGKETSVGTQLNVRNPDKARILMNPVRAPENLTVFGNRNPEGKGLFRNRSLPDPLFFPAGGLLP